MLRYNPSASVHVSKREEMLPSSAAIVTAEICATPRRACRPRITSCIGLRRQLHHFENGFFQSLDSRAHMLELRS